MAANQKIENNPIPTHVALIMDGNGRWAQQRGKARVFGHENGVQAVRETVEAAAEIGVKYLTFYAFSTENWSRPRQEVDTLMDLLVSAISNETPELLEKGVKLYAIGDIDSLPEVCRLKLKEAIDITKKNKLLNVTVALSYSSHWEIVDAVRKIAREVRENQLDPEAIDKIVFRDYLQSAAIPDPDLLIRTSGELRVSNFLLWQLAYTELYFTPVLWPDFRKCHFLQAISDFQLRDRRYGKSGPG